MEPISAAVTALAAGAAAGVSKITESSIMDAYGALKLLLSRRYPVVDLKQLEKDPDSSARRALLGEELMSANALNDNEIVELLKYLIERLQTEEHQLSNIVGVDLDELKAARLSIKGVVAGRTGVRIRRTETQGGITIEGVQSGISASTSPQERGGTEATATPPSAMIDKTAVGGDISVSTLHLHLGATGETRELALDPEGHVSVVENIGAAAPSLMTKPPENANPYKGLEAFQEDDEDRFFGRDAITDLLCDRFRALYDYGKSEPPPLRFLPILGPSGSGKSSLVRAGLIPKLVRQPSIKFRSPRAILFTPGVRPIESLARVLARIDTGASVDIKRTEEFEEALSKTYSSGEQEGLRRIAESLPNAESAPLILIIDQFEEVFSLCRDAASQRAFIDNLVNAASDPGGAVFTILTLRSDFLGSTVHHQALNLALSRQGIIVPVMSEDERRQAIERPALEAGRPIDSATVDLLMDQTAGRQGALPLLQFVLSQIWEGLLSGRDSATTVKNLGGVGGALAGEAQSIYDSLEYDQKRIAKRAFLSLVQLGEGARDTLRSSYLSEMTTRSDTEPAVRRALERFADPARRLIMLSSDPVGETRVEITHEALIDHWSTLRHWIEAGRDDIRLHRRFLEAARNWDTQNRPEGLLWRPPDLDLLKEFRFRVQHDLTAIEGDFLESSVGLQEREHEEQRSREEKDREHAQNQRILDAVGQLSVGIIVLDNSGVVLQVNHGFRRMTELPDSGVGRHCSELFSDNDNSSVLAVLDHCREKQSPATAVEVHPICSRRIVALLSAVRLDERKASARTLLCVVDITSRHLAEEALRQAQKMEAVGQLTGGVAHDFNNLLAVIVGNAEILLERIDQEKEKEFVQRIRSASQRGAELASRLLAFSRRQPLRSQPVSLRDLVTGMSGLLRRSLVLLSHKKSESFCIQIW